VSGLWCASAWLDGQVVEGLHVGTADGLVTELSRTRHPDDTDLAGLVLPGMANAHSHAFHRGLRGRTHRRTGGDGGTFWTWRTAMYELAGTLDPDTYRDLATAVFAELVATGWTAVGEFHYLHHAPGGTPYPDHAMELALADAAAAAGIRLTLLDTLYLRAGAGQPPLPEQRRFSDGSARAWLERWHALREVLPPEVTLGAAVHSVRAVGRGDLEEAVAGLPADVPLHAHVSEQPRENDECRAEHGLTPVGLLHATGALGPRSSAVHATHLTDHDVELLGATGTTAVFCPTTEADLGDGTGPARRLVDAGAHLALGTDQHAVVDPFLEARALEHGARCASLRRGVFDPAELLGALTADGHRSLGLAGGALATGAPADLVAVDTASLRTAGSDPAQLVLTATAADVTDVVVRGRHVVRDRVHTAVPEPGRALAAALARTRRCP